MTKLIEKQWNSYLKTVVPKDACAVQIDETKKAFYGGAIALFKDVMNEKGGEEEYLEKMNGILKEIEEFIMENAQYVAKH